MYLIAKNFFDIIVQVGIAEILSKTGRITYAPNKGKQQLSGEIFREAYVRLGLHYPPSSTLSYSFRRPPPTPTERTYFWIAPDVTTMDFQL